MPQPSTPQLFHNQEEEFAQLLELNDQLRSCLQDFPDINVTNIIFVGDQGNGKSSTVARLTGFNLPVGDGIATRAPIEVRIRECPPEEQPVHHIIYKVEQEEFKEKIEMASLE